MSVALSFRTEEENRDRLDALAESMDRNRNWLINEAIKNYLELNEWQMAKVEAGLEDIKHGRTYYTEEMHVRIAKRHDTAKKNQTSK